MILGFAEYDAQARRLAEALGQPYGQVAVHHFPDGESKVTLPNELPPHVVVCRSLDRPNEKLIELMLAANTARQLGARRLTLVAPYLCYMRQDTAFHPGEAVSQPIIGRFLAELFDDVITVDPHLHRTPRLIDAVPAKNAVALKATGVMSEFLRDRTGAFLLGPDTESLQWVRRIAERGDLEYGVASKRRLGDRQVEVTLPEQDWAGKPVVIVDDVISSGETIAMAAQQCLARGAKRVDVLTTHALFASGALERLQEVGVGEIWSTDSIPHSSNCLSLAGLLAEAVQAIC